MCYNPITIKSSEGYVQVPCGHCLECLKQYQNEWSNRMMEELKSCDGKAVFFTLTYSDEAVPKNYIYDYTVYRSPSDYNYSNVSVELGSEIRYIKSKGTFKLVGKDVRKSKYCGERLKESVLPWQPLLDLGLVLPDKSGTFLGNEVHILDFNIKRDNQIKFIENVRRVYSDYINSLSVPNDYDIVCNHIKSDSGVMEYDFDTYEGDMFEGLVSDDSYQGTDFHINFSDIPYRERPIMSFNSVRKEDVQKWLKRGRKRLNKEIKYFITSEYGPRTLRPHYHGVIFNVTEEEIRFMFKDWEKHFGFYSAENVDLSKGDMSYCAKYCSKGMYEHPLCSKDFFYTHKDGSISEYHSKHYERCLELFGMDEPIVDRTFHLVSKGLGIGYVDRNKERLLTNFKDIDFKTDRSKRTIEVSYIDRDFNIKEFKGIINDKSSRDYVECIDKLFREFNYKRNYKGEVVTYGMPKYYREKILSEGLRHSLAAYVQQSHVEVYQEKLRQIQSCFPNREDSENVLMLESKEREERERRRKIVYNKMKKQYNKCKL